MTASLGDVWPDWEPDPAFIHPDSGGQIWIGGTDPDQDFRVYSRRDGDRWEVPPGWAAPSTDVYFDAVVTMYRGAFPVEGLELRFPISDGPLRDDQLPIIHAAAEWVAGRVELGDRVLVRCQMGLNRSALVTVLAMLELGADADRAIRELRSTRSRSVLFNSHYEDYLRAWRGRDASG